MATMRERCGAKASSCTHLQQRQTLVAKVVMQPQICYSCSVQAVVTNAVVLRGQYQTLPVALYGWTIAPDDEQRATPTGGELAFSFKWEAPESTTHAFAGAYHLKCHESSLTQFQSTFPLRVYIWKKHLTAN